MPVIWKLCFTDIPLKIAFFIAFAGQLCVGNTLLIVVIHSVIRILIYKEFGWVLDVEKKIEDLKKKVGDLHKKKDDLKA